MCRRPYGPGRRRYRDGPTKMQRVDPMDGQVARRGWRLMPERRDGQDEPGRQRCTQTQLWRGLARLPSTALDCRVCHCRFGVPINAPKRARATSRSDTKPFCLTAQTAYRWHDSSTLDVPFGVHYRSGTGSRHFVAPGRCQTLGQSDSWLFYQFLGDSGGCHRARYGQ
jgi:hypothetical protein